jgi:para-nitrobenzyl esterase
MAGTFAILGSRLAYAVPRRQDIPIVETQYGKLSGVYVDGTSLFAGVPYGASTEGKGRFMPPARPAPWTGVRDASHPGPRAPQAGGQLTQTKDPAMRSLYRYFTGGAPNWFESNNDRMSEDCLVLNICTPNESGKRPVLVYIHGGGFATGDGVSGLGATKWAREEDIVVVAVNHRLNVLGYTYLGDFSPKYAKSGNAGMLDLVVALEWIRDNIANFGGDPANVTIFGESGGGGKVSTLCAMPVAKGLFNRAIVQSGSMLSVSTKEEATERALDLLKGLGLSESQVDQLQNLPLEKLLAANNPGRGGSNRRGFGPQPVVDGHVVLQQTWTPGAPATVAGIPMIIGWCKDESAGFALSQPELFDLDAEKLRDQVIKSGIPANDVDKLLALYKRDYPADDPSDTWFRMSSDRTARWNVFDQADRKLAGGPGSVYVYNFAWNTPVYEGRFRAAHVFELPMLWRRVQFSESESLSKQMAGAWAAFARSGNPNHAGLPNWNPYSTATRATMIFDAGKTHMAIRPSMDAMEILRKYPTGGLL